MIMPRDFRQTICWLSIAALSCYVLLAAAPLNSFDDDVGDGKKSQSIEESRLILGKWIETQQIISKERNEWQQGKEILQSRLELVKTEITTLNEKIAQAEATVAQANVKRDELLGEADQLKAATSQLTEAVTAMESEVRRLYAMVPEPVQTRLQPLFQRVPDEESQSRISVAERFQNVLGILNELNKANNELTVNFEVRNLADGKPAEVRALYIGLAQAYYVSAKGEAGIGRPSDNGWQWESSKDVGNDVLMALEILQGKQTPAFVPLPVKMK
jgi:hypothetical protein